MTGAELAAWLLTTHDTVRAVALTGFAAHTVNAVRLVTRDAIRAAALSDVALNLTAPAPTLEAVR